MKNHLKNQILTAVGSNEYRPSSKSEFARLLEVNPKDRSILRDVLRELEADRKITRGAKGRYFRPDQVRAESTRSAGKPSSTGASVTGKIDFPKAGASHRKGAYFIPDPEVATADRRLGDGDLYIPGRYLSTAMHGDQIEVKLYVKPSRSKKKSTPKYEAHVTNIVERANETIIGTFHKRGKVKQFSPDDSRLPETFDLVGSVDPKIKGRDKVVVQFLDWKSAGATPTAKIIQVLGAPDAPGVDMLSIIFKHGLPLEFPPEVLAEAEKISLEIPQSEIEKREDWRDRDVFTIDPKTARDFDDAIHVRRLDTSVEGDGKKEGWELAVHIADVSHYVKAGSALDKEAQKRGNSCYLADRVIPMLPEKLSNGVCSLVPHQDRLTHAAILRFDLKGNPISARFCSAVIHSAHRYTYEEAFERMFWDEKQIADYEEQGEVPIIRHLQEAWRLAKQIRARRFEHGALDMDFPEVKAVLDKEGNAVGISKSDYDESHQLIEEFMLVANEAVALRTKNHQSPSVYRIHEDPDSEKLDELADTYRGYGYSPHDLNIRKNLQAVLKAFHGTHEEYALKLALLKSLKRASYSPDPLGHYGLAKVNYTHFTSPIRRYADLVVHRVLRAITEGKSNADRTPNLGKLSEIAKHISITERKAADAEQESQRLKMMEYLLTLAESKDSVANNFPATVTDIRPMGIFIELDDLLIRGLIRSDDLPHGYRFESGSNQFLAVGDAPDIGLGDALRVRITRVERERQFIDFELAGPETQKKQSANQSRSRPRRSGGRPKKKTRSRSKKR